MRRLSTTAIASSLWLVAPPAFATTAHHLTAAVHSTVNNTACNETPAASCPGIDQADLNAAFFFSTIAIAADEDAVVSPEQDLPCDTRLAQQGPLGAFSTPLSADGLIDQADEMAKLQDSKQGFVLVVNDIFTCGSESNPMAWGGCASTGTGKPIVLDNEAINWTPPGNAGIPGVMLAHEFGHTQGIFHANGSAFIMSEQPLTNASVALAPGQCDVFRRVRSLWCPGPWGFCSTNELSSSAGTLAPQDRFATNGSIFDVPAEASGAAPLFPGWTTPQAASSDLPIVTLANSVIADSLPMDVLGKYDQADVGVLKGLLKEGQAVPKTAAVLIGLVSDGNVDDVAFLANLMANPKFGSQPAAAAALGLIATRHTNKAAVDALTFHARHGSQRVVSSAHLGLAISGFEEAERLMKQQHASEDLIAANRRIRREGWEKGYRTHEAHASPPEPLMVRRGGASLRGSEQKHAGRRSPTHYSLSQANTATTRSPK